MGDVDRLVRCDISGTQGLPFLLIGYGLSVFGSSFLSAENSSPSEHEKHCPSTYPEVPISLELVSPRSYQGAVLQLSL
jgi:hypothetical protein